MPNINTNIHNNRSSIARSVSESLGAPKNIEALASGLLNPSEFMPENDGQYRVLRNFLHDVFCLSLIDSGHYRYYELHLSDLGINTNNKRLNMQKPDLYTIDGQTILLGEVTTTYNPLRSKDEKVQKYQDFISTLRLNGYETTLTVFVVDLTDPEWFTSFPPISSLYTDVIEDLMLSLRIVHSNPRFAAIRKKETGLYTLDKFQFSTEDSTLTNLVEEATGVRMDASKIKLRLSGIYGTQEDDDWYLESVARSILDGKIHDRPKPMPSSMNPQSLMSDFDKFRSIKPNTKKMPRILQLGCPSKITERKLDYDESMRLLRICGKSGGYLDYILSALEREPIPESHLIDLYLSKAQVESEQKSGPGRKAYLRRNGLEIPREAPTHIGVSTRHINYVDDFINNLRSEVLDSRIHELRVQSIEQTGLSAYNTLENISTAINDSCFSAITKFYQLLSNEIVLNSMRRRKTRQYSLGYSGVEGVYFIVAPGPQLRTESNVEFIKIISMTPPVTSFLSSPWLDVNDHWESEWLSVDTDRLKHWQRSYDRCFLSLVANAERLVRPGVNLEKAVNEEIFCGNYGLLCLVYLENKQTTSTCNQTVRYLWMKALGDKQFDGLIDKFPKRVNSLLQSYIMQKSITTCVQLSKTDLSELVKVGRISRDEDTGNYDESTTGVTSLMPRLFTNGPPVTISYNLNEIYWCMMYNKDRQNTTQDAMSILSKILKEEDKYDNELALRQQSTSKVDYFLGTTTIQQDIDHIHSNKPESHYFSSRAVHIGVRLQDRHPDNMGDRSSWLNDIKLDSILSKNLSEFATFKASVKTICDYVDKTDLNELMKIGNRTKAIELVSEIVQNERLMTAAEVAMTYSGDLNKNFSVHIQIFKKNQIGGTREIIILFIKARILFNIVEEISRLLSKSDKREILTKGRDKRLMMRGDYEEVTSSFDAGTPLKIVKESYDMTTWAQKFIPTIFLPLYEHHFKSMPGILNLSRLIFLSHSNKKMEYPRKLVEQWMRHPDAQHKEVGMQKRKDKFLQDGKPWFVNHSNMCQGIPHYNSTVLALSCLSLRDELFKKCLKLRGMTQSIRWKTRVGSDDKGTIIGLDLTKKDCNYQYVLLGQCERAAERLMAMELSVKSASGHLMYELNSAFMANLETLSPTIKFSLAATDLIATTSCTNFVNESFSRIRQLRENGATSILCSLAHSLNERHFYDIFSTNVGQMNDLTRIFNMPLVDIPFDFGVYPTYDIDMQDIVGPEFYNYKLLKSNPKNPAFNLLYKSLTTPSIDELFPSGDTPLLKKDHFNINQGMIKQLTKMRSRLNANATSVDEFFQKNPFLIVRGPETIDETINVIHSKLFTKGASEALRRTSAAIYIGRLPAFKTSRSWTAPVDTIQVYNEETNELTYKDVFGRVTYSDFLKLGLRASQRDKIDMSGMMSLLFPQSQSFDVVLGLVGKFGVTRRSTKRYSQAVRTWTVNNFNYEYASSLKSIIETSFGTSDVATAEDVSEFKKLVSMSLSSLDNFVDECQLKGIRPVEMFYYMSKLYKSSKTSKIQTFANGPSTGGLHMTLLSIKRYNHSPGVTVELTGPMAEEDLIHENTLSYQFDKLKLLYNLIVMNDGELLNRHYSLTDLDIKINDKDLVEDCKTIIRSIKTLSGLDPITQKTIKLVACKIIPMHELKEKLSNWRTFNYSFLRKQKKTMLANGKIQWTGDLEVLITSDNECYTICETKGYKYISLKEVKDMGSLFRSLKESCKVLGIDMGLLFKQKESKQGDLYLVPSGKGLQRTTREGSFLNVLKIRYNPYFRYKRLSDLDIFKVETMRNPKTGEIQLYLKDKESRTATICHSNGNYYTVEIPRNTIISDKIEYLGVRLSKLLMNRSWFYNFRIPSMQYEECINFLRNDVNLDVILQQDARDVQRIQEYLEVREEINEESFSIMNDYYHNLKSPIDVNTSSSTMNDLFRSTMMNDISLPRELMSYDDDIVNWADDVQEEAEKNMDDLNKAIDGNEVIGIVRSLGYKRPHQRRAMNTVSSLQQGSVLRRRVLDCFFHSQNIRNEQLRQLPSMYIWIRINCVDKMLRESLCHHIIGHLSTCLGTSKSQIEQTINSSRNQLGQPVPVLHSMQSGDMGVQEDIMSKLLEEAEINNNSDYDSLSDEDS